MTWNCRIGGFWRKAEYIAPFRPDILAVQELEPIDGRLIFAGQEQPTYRGRLADPAYPRRAVGLFSYTGVQLSPVDTLDPMYGFRRYEARRGGLSFQVAAVWTAATDAPKRHYRQAHEGIVAHAEWIRSRPTIILGDFNNNGTFGKSWRELLELMRPLGLASAYHRHFGEEYGCETRPTHVHRGKHEAPFHLDYCFVPEAWCGHIDSVTVGEYAAWHEASDHAPLIVDLAETLSATA